MDEKQLKQKPRGKPFSPGVSGNPAGRPVKDLASPDAKWGYRVLNISSKPEELEEALNALALEGWELTSAQYRQNNSWVLVILRRKS